MRQMVPFFSLLIILIASTVAFAQRDLKDIPVPDPEEERRTFVVADGFEVNLFAADPLIHKPIQINFDPQGRLWVAASEVYPQIAPGQVANDKILILEDKDGDGVADSTTVFADGLLIPTGVVPGDGGAYVANSTELLHLSDTDGDGKADKSRIVLSGFGTEDTHHIIHTFRWGPDGLFYFNQSIYIHSHVETPYGVKRLNAGGIWQFRPDTLQLDVLARGWVNTWGHAFDRWGTSFVTDGAGGEGINYLVPGAAYPTAFGVSRILHGLNPGSPKYCGLEMVDGRHLPDDWQGNLITHDFRGHRVCRFALSEDGSGFAARQQPDLISSQHVAFRPIDVKQGPDGAIYIADWYNPIIQHGEVDFRDPRRDHVHGRIWRVTAKGRPLVKRPKLTELSVRDLLNQLDSPETDTRMHAKQVLKERGRDAVLQELASWVRHLDIETANYEPRLLEAMWVYQALDVAAPAVLSELLRAGNPNIRAAAVRQVPHWKDREGMDRALDWLAERVVDEHPRVRLEAVCALRAFPSQQAAEIALRAADLPLDEFLDYALWQTARELKAHWLPTVQAGRFDDGGQFRRLLFAIRAAEATEAVPVIVERLQSGRIAAEDRSAALDLIGTLGQPDHLRIVFDLAVADGVDRAQAGELLRALLQAQRQRNAIPSGDLQGIARLAGDDDPQTATTALECIGAWKLAALEPLVSAAARNAQRTPALRSVAVTTLAGIGGVPALKSLQELAQAADTEALRSQAIAELVKLQPQRAAQLALAWWPESKNPADQSRVFAAFLQRRDGGELLAKALADKSLPEDVAKIGLRAISGSGRDDPALRAALVKAGQITSEPKELSPAEMATLVAEVKERGNPAHGEAIFRRADLNCFKCHAIGGAGGKVGPDLLSLGASAQVDYLIDSLLVPTKNVKEGYHSVVVQTDAGKVLTGVKVRQTESHLIIRDAEDVEQSIPLTSIEEQAPGISLMPAGLTEKLTRQELVDLVRFLSELGKPGPYAVGTASVARRWEALLPTQQSYTRLTRTSDAQLMADDANLQWQPVYTTVSGHVPLQELPNFTTNVRLVQASRKVAFVRTAVQVTTGGEIGLQVGDVRGLQLWIDGRPVEMAPRLNVTLEPGVHRLAFGIDLKATESPLRLELTPVPGSPAQAQFVTGK